MEIIETLLFMAVTKYIEGSIAGVTYMDNFDFEERYRDTNQCNPLYWYPLHLPGHCVEMFEKLIRKNIATLYPASQFQERFNDGEQDEISDPIMPSVLTAVTNIYAAKRRLSPMEKLIEMIRNDALTIPTAPQIQIASPYGPMATYHQPISSRSEKAIKQISGAYRKAMMENYEQLIYNNSS